MKLTQGREASFDATDLDMVSKYTWSARIPSNGTCYYVQARGEDRNPIALHRLLLGNPSGEVDHVDGNGLNNQRVNLRTGFNNQHNIRLRRDNKSGMNGLHWDTYSHGWKVTWRENGRQRTKPFIVRPRGDQARNGIQKAKAKLYRKAIDERFGITNGVRPKIIARPKRG